MENAHISDMLSAGGYQYGYGQIPNNMDKLRDNVNKLKKKPVPPPAYQDPDSQSRLEDSPDAMFIHYKNRGIDLLRALEMPGAPGYDEPSAFDTRSLIGHWGCTDETLAEGGLRLVQYSGFKGIGDLVGHDQGARVLLQHSREIRQEGSDIRYPVTLARYENVFWPTHGVILAVHNESPQYMVRDRYRSKGHWSSPTSMLPTLSHWSDVVYLSWMRQSSNLGTDPSALQYVYQRRVRNEQTLIVLAFVLRLQRQMRGESDGAADKAPTWPSKRVIHRSEIIFPAMLYTPCVRGTVKLLTQHRKVFGNRRIRAISIYTEDGNPSYEPTLVIEIEKADGVRSDPVSPYLDS